MTINRRLPVGNLSPPGDGMVIITQLTQVRKEKNGKNGGYPRLPKCRVVAALVHAQDHNESRLSST